MHEDAPYLTPEHVRASTLLAAAQLRYLLDEAEHQDEHDNQAGLDAISVAMRDPLTLLSSVAQPLEAIFAPLNTPERDEATDATRRELESIEQRVAAYGLNAHPQDGSSRDPGTHLISAVMTVLSSSAAGQELSQHAADQALGLPQRWRYIVAAHQANLIAHQHAKLGLEETSLLLEQTTNDQSLAWLRLKEQIETMTARPILYATVFQELCANSGVQHPSPSSSKYPDEVRFLIEHRQAMVEWEMGAWYFEASEFDLLELIRFEHDNQCYIKTIHEPYPNGYPAQLVKDQMVDLLEELGEHFSPDEPYAATWFTTAQAMHQAAAQSMHSISHHEMTAYLDDIKLELDDPAIADCLMRSATGHNRELAMLLTPYGGAPPPIAETHQIQAILNAGRKAGMNAVQLWEMTLLMGAEPDEHQLTAPTISGEDAYLIQQAAEKHGIPPIIHMRRIFKVR